VLFYSPLQQKPEITQSTGAVSGEWNSWGREVDCSPPSGGEVKNEWSCTSSPP